MDDGAMGRWGDGAMGRWGDGAMAARVEAGIYQRLYRRVALLILVSRPPVSFECALERAWVTG